MFPQFNQSEFDVPDILDTTDIPDIPDLSGQGPLRRQAFPTPPPFPFPFFPNEDLANILNEALNGPELQLLICDTSALDAVELENAVSVFVWVCVCKCVSVFLWSSGNYICVRIMHIYLICLYVHVCAYVPSFSVVFLVCVITVAM